MCFYMQRPRGHWFSKRDRSPLQWSMKRGGRGDVETTGPSVGGVGGGGPAPINQNTRFPTL